MGESPLASPASHQPGGPRPFRSSSTSATVVQYSSVTEHGTTCVPGPLSSSAPTYEKAPGSGRRSGSITSKDLDQVTFEFHHYQSAENHRIFLSFFRT